MALDVVGISEIADRLDVLPGTVRMWRYRSRQVPGYPMIPFPEPEATVSGQSCWRWPTVRRWAEATGRVE